MNFNQSIRIGYYIAIAGIIFGIFFSRAVLSLSDFLLACVFLIEGNFKTKFQTLKQNRAALLILGLFALHLIGLIFTSDFEYAFKDIRIKLPLLIFPVVFGSGFALSIREFRLFNYLYLLFAFSATLIVMLYYQNNVEEISDVRYASFLISHIRLSLLLVVAIVLSIYAYMKVQGFPRLLLTLNVLWILYFLVYFEAITGLVILAIIAPVLLMWIIIKRANEKKTKVKILIGITLIAFLVASGISVFLVNYYNEVSPKEHPDLEYTGNGNRYVQDYRNRNFKLFENGYNVYQNVCYVELEKEWNRRSEVQLTYSDPVYFETENVLLRFISSKGMAKDSAAIVSLSEAEIKAIENNIPNYLFMDASGFEIRVRSIMWELVNYFNGGNFNGHSLAMRIEYWKTCSSIIIDNFWFGTGTGDIVNAFKKQYEDDQSMLTEEFRLRAHNQYLTIAATFGIFGLIYFLIVVFQPMIEHRHNMLFLCFSIIYLCSLMAEDTLETQVGVTFYAFLGTYFLYLRPTKK